MPKKIKIVRIDYKYCNYLRQYDNRVFYNMGQKNLRPFIGVLFEVNNYKYFAPLSSPKTKHELMKSAIDFIKIDGGRLGVVNINNMIPVIGEEYEAVDLNKKSTTNAEQQYQKLLKLQLTWLNRNIVSIQRKAHKLYEKYNEKKLPISIFERCCNFRLLEEKSADYFQLKSNNKQ